MNGTQKQQPSGETIRARVSGRPSIFILLIVLVIGSLIGGIEVIRQLAAGPKSVRDSANPPNRAKTAFPRQLQDGSGHTLTIKSRPQRIVSQTLGTDEILLAICEPQRVVAFSKFALDPEYSNVIDLVRERNARRVESTEDILTLNPDLIFIAHYSRAEVAEQLQTTGAPVFRFASFESIEDIKNNIRIVGYATGDDDRAAEVVAEMDRRLEASRARILSNTKSPRVLSYSQLGSTAGSHTLFDDIIRTSGAINVGAEKGLTGFQKVSAEQLTEWQPDFIVVGSDSSDVKETRRLLLENPAVAATKAAHAGRIIVMDNRLFLTVSHRVVDTVDALISELYATRPARDK